MRALTHVLLALLGLLLTHPGLAQQDDVPVGDEFGRETPRGTALGFLAAADRDDYEAAARYLDLRNLPADAAALPGERLAEQLEFIVERNLRLDPESLSDSPAGAPADGLPAYRDLGAVLQTPAGPVELWLQRVPADAGVDGFIWKISNRSVARIPELYELYRYPGWVESFRDGFPLDGRLLGVAVWKWVLSLTLTLLLLPLAWALLAALARAATASDSELRPALRRFLCRPVLALLVNETFGFCMARLGLGLTGQQIARTETLRTILIVWVLFGLIELIRVWRRLRFEAEGRADAAILGRPIARALKLLTVVGATLYWLDGIGVDITALLAGLGIGGVALALAMQKPIEDLLGAVSLYSQRPVETGQTIRYAGVLGRVEEIGLRTTRIRTVANTVLSVPNSRLAYDDLENISARARILFDEVIRLRADTDAPSIEAIVAAIERLLTERVDVLEGLQRVHLRQFGEYGPELRVQCNIDTVEMDAYLQSAHEINLAILAIVYESGAALARPELLQRPGN
ncbi:MAG: mechanosensitive ion channel family protein [Pseudomonadota bacterium]